MQQRITPDEIKQRAYELWERNGRQHGSHLEHWLQAERDLDPERSQGRTAAAPPAPPAAPRRRSPAKPKAPKTPAIDSGAGAGPTEATVRNSQRA